MPTPCPGCNKFPSLEVGDVEVDDLEINEDGVVTGTVHFVLVSGCCNEEMKEYTFDIEHQMSLKKDGALDELYVEGEAEIDEIRFKGKKAYKLSLEITVSGDRLEKEMSETIEDTVLSSEMEEMI